MKTNKDMREKYLKKLIDLSGEKGFSFCHVANNKMIIGDVICNLDEMGIFLSKEDQIYGEPDDFAEFLYCQAMTYLISIKNMLNMDEEEFVNILIKKMHDNKHKFKGLKSRPGFRISKVTRVKDVLQ